MGDEKMNITYIHHSCFLVETERFYLIFDYFKGELPNLNVDKTIYVFSSHSHDDHYNKDIFDILKAKGMKSIKAVLSDDISVSDFVETTLVSPNYKYNLDFNLKCTTFKSTDLGVAFLIDVDDQIIYHAGDLNDWVWDEETDAYNTQMTIDYQKQIRLLKEELNNRQIDVAFVVLDPRQETDYARGMTYFLDNIPTKIVYPMYYWEDPTIIDKFINEYPQYQHQVYKTE